jgi:hypothetical protein
MEIYFFIFNIKIHDESSDYNDIGSSIKFWAYSKNFDEAEIMIKKQVSEYNWKLGDCIEKRIITKEDQKNNLHDQEYFEKAIKLGTCALIQTKPIKK